MADFGWALEQVNKGRRVCRQGWNGKGMFIVKMDGYPEGIPVNENTAKAFGIEFGTTVKVRPYLAMLDAQGYIVSGWLASMTDMLSTDWEIQE